MTKQEFDKWLKRLKNAWETKKPNVAADLCAEKFLWYETPFDKPFKNKSEILQEWQTVLSQKNISVSYEILSIKGNIGIAHWKATFTRLLSQTKAALDGIYKVTLNQKGECIEFHQWYNSKK